MCHCGYRGGDLSCRSLGLRSFCVNLKAPSGAFSFWFAAQWVLSGGVGIEYFGNIEAIGWRNHRQGGVIAGVLAFWLKVFVPRACNF